MLRQDWPEALSVAEVPGVALRAYDGDGALLVVSHDRAFLAIGVERAVSP
jgi:hypothetical protein